MARSDRRLGVGLVGQLSLFGITAVRTETQAYRAFSLVIVAGVSVSKAIIILNDVAFIAFGMVRCRYLMNSARRSRDS